MNIDPSPQGGYSNRWMVRVFLLSLLLGLAGCRSDRFDTPDDAYRLFSSALKRSDGSATRQNFIAIWA